MRRIVIPANIAFTTMTPHGGQSIWIPAKRIQKWWHELSHRKQSGVINRVNRINDKHNMLLSCALMSGDSMNSSLDAIERTLEEAFERINSI